MFQFLKDHCAHGKVNLILADGIFDFVICIDVGKGTYLLKYARKNLPYLLNKEGEYTDFLQCLRSRLCSDEEEFLEAMKLIGIIGALEVRDGYTVSCRLKTGGRVCHKNILFSYDRAAGDGSNKHLFACCEDVTPASGYGEKPSDREKRELEEQKEASNVLQNHLVYLSHEIRTSVNSIYGNLSALKMEERLDNKYLENAFLSAEYLLRLVNGALSVSKMENDAYVIKNKAVAVKELLEYPRAVFEREAKEKGIRLQFLFEKPIYQYLYLNREIVWQIILNLVSNAVKYTDSGGLAVCRLSETYLAERRVKVSLEVSDTGIGMDEEFLAEKFSSDWKKFARERRKKEAAGSGLGLFITKRLVELLQGRIWISSRKGEGTSVFVEFEAGGACASCELENCMPEYAGMEENKGDGIFIKRVLAAEDEETNMDSLCRYLEQLGIEADRASSGDEIIEMFVHSVEEYYDAILMDINMPGKSGIEAAYAIRGLNRKDSSLPIITMTADTFGKYKKAAASAGISGYITKPYSLEDIISVLSKCQR